MARPRSPSRAGSEDPQSKLGEAYILLLLQVYGGIYVGIILGALVGGYVTPLLGNHALELAK